MEPLDLLWDVLKQAPSVAVLIFWLHSRLRQVEEATKRTERLTLWCVRRLGGVGSNGASHEDADVISISERKH